MSKFIPYGHQCIEEDDIRAVVEVLRSDFLTQGPKVKEFDGALADYCGAKYAVSFSSGTAALHGAYFAAGIKDGGEVITSPITFLATANAALFLGGRPVFVDVEPDTGNIDAGLVEPAITSKTKAVVPVHFAGHPADMEKIAGIAREHNLIVIEDACHALGAKYLGSAIGDCKYSDMAVFSFHPVKSITTGEGGAVLTNNKEYHEKLVMFRQHGVTKADSAFVNKSEDAGQWYYEMQHLGYNYRLTDIQCALGISQLKKLDIFIHGRRRIANAYNRAFKGNPFFDLPVEKSSVKSAWHLYAIRLNDEYKSVKPKIFEELHLRGVGVQVHYIPVYLQPYYRRLGYSRDLCPKAKDLYEREISIPIFRTMSDEDVQYVEDNVLSVFEQV
ncbi:MAG: UDP-4-amino-4,6-dideoxy-N-acetyl-beta-L-altrosamine transaminase [Phycisphaerae bacterium]|nr:UDP-4-amino-4,6-dideoxy-N-acetyl-beta-L-altrosamine transaminase [Phycisphaerae bacterium]MDD5381834.1 UDP-4-amino-4,6-dideoxy-N-acetyl-beta-L-altrosamine transaminase [Phycisphaerae bacterium]